LRHRLRQGLAGENADLARRVRGGAGGDAGLFVVPAARDQVCLYGLSGGACTFVDEALAGRFISSECRHGPGATVTGMLPDGATSAAVVLRSGTRLPLDVVDNVYWFRASVDDPPERVEWRGPGDGSVDVPPVDC
jgi:hypothetical protein